MITYKLPTTIGQNLTQF